MVEVELPEAWIKSDLERISTDISYGYTAPANKHDTGVKMLRITDIQHNKVQWSEVPFCEIDDSKLKKYKLEENDLVFARTGATVGKSFLIKDDVPMAVYASYLIRVRCASTDIVRLLAHFFNSRSYWQQITDFTSGIGQPNVNGTKLKSLIVPLPPLNEQKVIADKLDTLLAQVETIKARLERIPNIIKRFRQSVLAAAVSGELTEEWRRSYRPSQSVEEFSKAIESYRYKTWVNEQEAKFAAKGKWPKNKKWKEKYKKPSIPESTELQEIPEGWVFEPLEGLVYISARIGWKGLKASEYTKEGPLFLSVHALNYGMEVELSEAFHISVERYEESPEIKLKNDDILLCKDGAGIGKLAIVKKLDEPATINSSLLLIRSGKFFVPEYLYYFLAGPRMQSIVQERMIGSAVPHLFQRDVKEFVLEIPPLQEQREIVRLVEQFLTYADTIEQQVQSALARVNNLAQSILAKAFRGELTAEWRTANPDLISGDNSAEALLAKIKVERDRLAKQQKIRKPVVKKKTGKKMSAQIISVYDALKLAGKPLSGQQLLAAAGYPVNSGTEQLEQFFLDLRDALYAKQIIKQSRDKQGQDWFALAG